MEYYQLELTIIAAENLKDVRHLAKMQTYATAWIDSNLKYKTEIDEVGGVNPVWKDKFAFLVPKHVLGQEGVVLKIEIYTNSLTGSKLVGKALIELQPQNAAENGLQYADRPIKASSGHAHGQIYVSYRWKERVTMEPLSQRKLVGAVSNSPQGLMNVNPYISTHVIHKNQANSSTSLPQKSVNLKKSYSSSSPSTMSYAKELGHSLKARMRASTNPHRPAHKQLPVPTPPPHATSLHTSSIR